jgi:hypothetical protein
MEPHGFRTIRSREFVGSFGRDSWSCALAALALTVVCAASRADPLQVAVPSSALQPIPAAPPPRGEAATDLRGEFLSDPISLRVGAASLVWIPATSGGLQQRVLLATRPEGFREGDYALSEALPAEQGALVWQPLGGARYIWWKVQTLQPWGWAESDVATLERPPQLETTEPPPTFPLEPVLPWWLLDVSPWRGC